MYVDFYRRHTQRAKPNRNGNLALVTSIITRLIRGQLLHLECSLVCMPYCHVKLPAQGEGANWTFTSRPIFTKGIEFRRREVSSTRQPVDH